MTRFDFKKIDALAVMLHNTRIGIINRLMGDRYVFSFEDSYVNDSSRSILSLSFKGQADKLITSTRLYNTRLPPFFSNLLPEGHLRTYLAEKADVKPEHEFFLLAALGADLPGALKIVPLEMGEYSEIQNINEQGENNDDALLRFSLAGIQLKFSAIAEAGGGLTVPADGMGGSWIVKLPSPRFDAVPENEFVMLALARSIGITLPRNHLVDIRDVKGLPKEIAHAEGKAIAIERFDRAPNKQRIHMEDFAQVFGLFPWEKYKQRSYANIASVLLAETGEVGVHEYVRRLAFSILIGNADMHLKNWSIIYPDKHTPVLSPAYDFVSTLPYIKEDQLALNFGGSYRIDKITLGQVRRFSEKAQLSVSDISALITETIEKATSAWQTLPEKDLLPLDMRRVIDKQIETASKNTQL
ncbi:MAG TPA: HipA domain-containing protein [Gammaproteobacteria bacterium]|jgi:serine/threonine-protein kinase HipA|nr:HipA domain-containing protein [Gammaproteobacteria bacterium]